jgi:hypothetical protein
MIESTCWFNAEYNASLIGETKPRPREDPADIGTYDIVANKMNMDAGGRKKERKN